MCPSTNISILFVALSILCMQTDVAWGHLKVTILDRWSDAQVIKKILEEKWAAARVYSLNLGICLVSAYHTVPLKFWLSQTIDLGRDLFNLPCRILFDFNFFSLKNFSFYIRVSNNWKKNLVLWDKYHIIIMRWKLVKSNIVA